MIIKQGDRLVLALSDRISAEQAAAVKDALRRDFPELSGVGILTGVTGMAVVRAGDDRCPNDCGHTDCPTHGNRGEAPAHSGHYGAPEKCPICESHAANATDAYSEAYRVTGDRASALARLHAEGGHDV